MRIVTKLLVNSRNNSVKKLIETQPDPSLVSNITADDGIVFDGEGLPVEFTLDLHKITKTNYTPTMVYNEPYCYPWSEQVRNGKSVFKEQQIERNAPVYTTPDIHIAKPIIGDKIEVYNGYPIMFDCNGKSLIAFCCEGDKFFDINETYSLFDQTKAETYHGKIIEVLDCNNFTADVVFEKQGIILYV
jgi:hypothetical protein